MAFDFEFVYHRFYNFSTSNAEIVNSRPIDISQRIDMIFDQISLYYQTAAFLIFAPNFFVNADRNSSNSENTTLGAELISWTKNYGIPFLRQNEEALKMACLKRGGIEAYSKATQALSNMHRCVYSDVYPEFQTGTNIPESDLAAVSKRYCDNLEAAKRCVLEFFDRIESCMSKNQKINRRMVQNAFVSTHSFVCANEGDHVAMFISERGVECLVTRQKGIEKCLETYVDGETLNDWMMESEEMRQMDLEDPEEPFSQELLRRRCKTGLKIRNCLASELLKCPSKVPANVVEAVLNLFLCSSECHEYIGVGNYRCNSAKILYVSFYALFFLALGCLFVSKTDVW